MNEWVRSEGGKKEAYILLCGIVISEHFEDWVLNAPYSHLAKQRQQITRSTDWVLTNEPRFVSASGTSRGLSVCRLPIAGITYLK